MKNKKKVYDKVLVKQYVTDKAELTTIKQSSGILGLDDADHNVGCVEANNITINTRRLGESLKHYLIAKGVKITCGKKVNLVMDGYKIKHVECEDDQTIITGDKFVVCAGYDSNRLLKSVGLNIPLVPIKAYSLHISKPAVADKWKYAVHIQAEVAGLFTPYREEEGNSVRVTGIRDMDGVDPFERPERVEALMQVARRFAGY